VPIENRTEMIAIYVNKVNIARPYAQNENENIRIHSDCAFENSCG
jgi:hypothetical protein